MIDEEEDTVVVVSPPRKQPSKLLLAGSCEADKMFKVKSLLSRNGNRGCFSSFGG